MVMAPIVRGRKGEYGKQLAELRSEGFTRVKVDGELRQLEEEIVLDKKFKHDISVVVDRLVMRPDLRKRLADSVETAVALADGILEVETVPRDGEPEIFTYSERFACLHCGISMPELEPRSFSFNAPHGACPRCTGLGSMMEIDPELVVPDPSLSINEGAILPWSSGATGYYEQIAQAIADRYEVDVDAPWEDLPEERPGPVPLRHQRRQAVRHLPQPDGAQAVVHDDLRGHRPQPRAPLQGDGLRLVAGEDRGVHVDAPVPGVRGRAPAAGVAGGEGRRDPDPRVHAALGQAGDRVDGRARALQPGPGDRAADPARDRRAAALPGQRRRRLPLDGACVVDLVGRRGAADPARDADRLVAGRRALHPRRAVDRPAPARQRAADQDAGAPARPRQHRARGRARRGHDARGGLRGRHGPGRRRARRPRRRARDGRGDHGGQGVADRAVPVRDAPDRGAREAPQADRLRRDHRGDPEQPPGTSTSRCRSASSAR